MKIQISSRVYTNTFFEVDEDDFSSVNEHNWHLLRGKYVYRTENIKGKKKTILLHRQLMNPPRNLFVDHINGDGLDNRRSNLRVCTHQQNLWNISKKKFKGVYIDRHGKIFSQIHYRGKSIYLGQFPTRKKAAIAYNTKAKELFKEFANLNKGV